MGKKRCNVMAWFFTGMLVITSPLQAAGNHAHDHDDNGGDHHAAGMKHDDHGSGHGDDHGHSHGSANKMFLKEKKIDGYNVTFHIMKAKPGKEMGGSHDFMIKVEKNGKALTNIVMNTKVVHPNGQSETKKAMVMGDWLMAGYDLGHKGKHQMMILFKTADGKKHKGGIYYTGS